MNGIDISVIIPTRNRAVDLRRCLAALAGQDFPKENFEVIVCDDGSEESIQPIVEEFVQAGLNVRYAHQEPRGPAAARNLGIRQARAEIVAMTDSDTIPDQGWLSKLFEALQSNPQAAGVEGLVYANNEGQFDPLGEGPRNHSGGVFLTCNCAYRREVLVGLGGFDETFPFPAYEDTELAARAQQWGPIVWQPEAVVVHPERPLTIRAVIKKLHHWDYVVLMGLRYGYLAWRQYPARYPRLRVALLSVIALPAAKFKTAARWLFRKPSAAIKLAGLGVIESAAALLIVAPRALFGRYKTRIVRHHYLDSETPRN